MNQNATPCVFIADDDEDDSFLLTLAFNQHSSECQLNFSADGAALLEVLASRDTQPALIILDLNMPRVDGFEALRRLRENPLYQLTPIVILTTSAAEEDRQRANELGADEFITKPLHTAELGQTVRRLRSKWLVGTCC